MEKQLNSVFYNPRTGFMNLNDLWLAVRDDGLKYRDVAEWYRRQPINQLFVKKKARFRKITCPAVGCLQVDLMDVSRYAAKNKQTKFLLNAVDVFSRKAWSFPQTNKSAKQTAASLGKLFRSVQKAHPKNSLTMTSDLGSEFVNDTVQRVLRRWNVEHYTIDNSKQNHPTKTGIVERFNRTLLNIMRKYITANDSVAYLQVLPDFLENYNNRAHRSIQARPEDVFRGDVKPDGGPVRRAEQTKVGSKVRVLLKDKLFSKKSLEPKYTKEVFEVIGREGNRYRLAGKRLTFLARQLKVVPAGSQSVAEQVIEREKKTVRRQRRKVRRRKQTGVDEANIVEGKRMRKAKFKA